MDCACDLDFNCGQHDDAAEWSWLLGVRPEPHDVIEAYDRDDYKGKFWAGWD